MSDAPAWPPDDDDEHRGHHRELWEEQAARDEQADLDPPDGAEPDRAAAFEQARRSMTTAEFDALLDELDERDELEEERGERD